jgi:hypothetical protein
VPGDRGRGPGEFDVIRERKSENRRQTEYEKLPSVFGLIFPFTLL